MIVTCELDWANLVVSDVAEHELGDVLAALKSYISISPELGVMPVDPTGPGYDDDPVFEAASNRVKMDEPQHISDIMSAGLRRRADLDLPDPQKPDRPRPQGIPDVYGGSPTIATNGETASSQSTVPPDHGSGRQHLEAPDLDDDDALARIAFDAYQNATGYEGAWGDGPKIGWQAAAAAVRAAALLQQADRVTAET